MFLRPDGAGPLPEWFVVAGLMASVDGVRCYQAAGWDGERWHGIGPTVTDPSSSDVVAAMVVHQGRLVIGGRFNSLPNPHGVPVPMGHVAQLVDGEWQPLGAGVLSGGSLPVAMLAMFNGEIVAGGAFSLSGQQGANVARWTGSQWSIVAGGPSGSSGVGGAVENNLALFQGQLYAGGSGSRRARRKCGCSACSVAGQSSLGGMGGLEG